jgi:hypothetical protein
VPATYEVTLVPARLRPLEFDRRKPSDPAALAELLQEGYGELRPGPGDPVVERTPDGSPAPKPGPRRRRVARFAHVADIQLADDQSPARVAAIDAPVAIDGAFRPQEGHECRILDAVVRTVNRIHDGEPLDLVLMGGDNIDNAQDNELDWLLGILGGGRSVRCASGDLATILPENEAPKLPFTPDGFRVPWLWITGNHDVLNQGNYRVTVERVAQSIGDKATDGTRDYSKPGAPVLRGIVPADPARKLLDRAEIIGRVAADARGPLKGHGLGAYALQTGRAYYTYDLPGSPVRIMGFDTSAETGSADGLVRRADLDGFVKPELARAKQDGKWLVVASHHAGDTITDGGGVGGMPQPDAVPLEEWEKTLSASGVVILDLVGHAHKHRVRWLGRKDQGTWEVQTAAIADFPHQFRVVEIWDEDDGWLTVRSVAMDYLTGGDPVIDRGRAIGVADFTSGWAGGGAGEKGDRNVTLWIPRP